MKKPGLLVILTNIRSNYSLTLHNSKIHNLEFNTPDGFELVTI